jgi:hypothetical protein
MINRDDNAVQWALWIDELKEAHELLGKLIEDLTVEHDYDDKSRTSSPAFVSHAAIGVTSGRAPVP